MFVKLFTQILDSSIADDRRLRHFFTDFLLCADMRGFVIMTKSAISRRIGATLEEVEWGIAELQKPDPRSKTPDSQGARIEALDGAGYGWHIINFEAYRDLKSADDMREKTKERVRRFREAKKLQTGDVTQCNASVTPCNAGNTIQRKKQKQKQMQSEKQIEREEEERDDEADHVGFWPELSKEESPKKDIIAPIFEKWATMEGVPRITTITESRKKLAYARMKEPFFRENWIAGMEAIRQSPFLTGKNDRGWKADIDWFLRPDSLPKILEGKYETQKTGFNGIVENLKLRVL
jgi:hypothetical protein